jgi:Family of unknown function (DUF6152)
MSKALLAAVLGTGTGIAVISSADAHHSFALFDVMKTVALEGTVKKFEWANPHSWITLEIVGPQNTAEEWLIELPPAGILAREGWNSKYVKVGEKLSVHINPLKNGGKGGILESFTFDDRRPGAQ